MGSVPAHNSLTSAQPSAKRPHGPVDVRLRQGDHSAGHFPAHQVVRAFYREILERRAEENAADFVNGVGTALTPMVFLETVIVRSYENLVDSATTVDVHAGLVAAGRLQAILDSRAGQPDMAHMMVKLNRVIEAVRSMVPESSWPELLRRLEGDTPAPDRLGSVPADEEFDPLEFAEEEDDAF